MKIFLSYAREDEGRVNAVYELATSAGFEPWMDTRKLVAGMDWESEIEREIKQCDIFLLFMSAYSVNKRGIIQREIKVALRKAEEYLPGDIFIVPVLLEPCEVPDTLRKYQWLDTRRAGWETELIQAVVQCQRQRRGSSAFSIEGGGVFPVVMERIEERDSKGKIHYQIPRLLIPGDGKRTREINDVVVGLVRRFVLDYRARCEEWELAINSYFKGAAHGNVDFETINIFVPKVSLIAMESIFSRERSYAAAIFEEISTTLSIELDQVRAKVDEWTGFAKFTLTKRGMTFFFDMLLGRADGPQIVEVSAAKLRPYLANSTVAERLKILWSS
jgi:TIR domain